MAEEKKGQTDNSEGQGIPTLEIADGEPVAQSEEAVADKTEAATGSEAEGTGEGQVKNLLTPEITKFLESDDFQKTEVYKKMLESRANSIADKTNLTMMKRNEALQAEVAKTKAQLEEAIDVKAGKGLEELPDLLRGNGEDEKQIASLEEAIKETNNHRRTLRERKAYVDRWMPRVQRAEKLEAAMLAFKNVVGTEALENVSLKDLNAVAAEFNDCETDKEYRIALRAVERIIKDKQTSKPEPEKKKKAPTKIDNSVHSATGAIDLSNLSPTKKIEAGLKDGKSKYININH